ncbi:MAG: tetratricopeptide repeat protein [Candidatus Omnitrophica bacterium]|nr:tetratricopeptide repeat protein [Candidatus Omnitrophota bacterium]
MEIIQGWSILAAYHNLRLSNMAEESERLQEGAALAKSGQYDQALSIFQEVLQINPDHVEALFLAGACHYKLGDNDQASECWNRVLGLDPNHTRAKGMLAKIPPTSDGGTDSFSTPSAPVQIEKPSAPSAPKAAPKRQPRDTGGMVKKIAVLLAILVLVGFGADMYLNPSSYPFLSKRSGQSENAEQPSPAASDSPAEKKSTPLATGISGKWFFLFEGSPSEFNFHPNGRLAVTIKREGGLTFNMDGSYEISGDTITFTVNTPEGPEQVKAYNAKIVGPDFTFNYDSPDGPKIEAERR